MDRSFKATSSHRMDLLILVGHRLSFMVLLPHVASSIVERSLEASDARCSNRGHLVVPRTRASRYGSI